MGCNRLLVEDVGSILFYHSLLNYIIYAHLRKQKGMMFSEEKKEYFEGL